MGAGARNRRDSGFTVVSPTRICQPSARLVRLSQLRKLCECEQVAAVCYRVCGGAIEFLLVRTRGGGRWTFPKGSAEPGLTHAQAAALEAFEEAGVHGRIEEAAFATYVRRERDRAGRSSKRPSAKELTVSAHLCEVSRLTAPKEFERNRTWFSPAEARQCLREGRRSEDGAEFARVIDKAVARLQRPRAGAGIVDHRPRQRPQQDQPQQNMPQTDGLQKVRFEAFVEGRGEHVSFMQSIRRQLDGTRQFTPIVEGRSGEVLRGDVLQFEPVRDKKAKALGTGAKNG